MRTKYIIGMLALSAACASKAPVQVSLSPNSQGTYRFHEILAQSSNGLVLEGRFTLTSDSVTVTTAEWPCEPVTPPDVRSLRVRCRDLVLSFDRRNPVNPSFQIPGRRIDRRQTCLVQKVSASGQMVCDQYSSETVEVETTFTGRLRVTRL